MGTGRRYSKAEPKLNKKKVVAVVIALAVILMFLIGFGKIIGKGSSFKEKNIALKYFTIYTGQKYGVMDSKGNIIIQPTYDEMIIIPNETKDIFFCTQNVDYENGTYQTKVLNKKGQEQHKGYDSVEPIQNVDGQNVVTYEGEILKVRKGDKYGIIDYKGHKLLDCEYEAIEPIKGTRKSILLKKENQYGLMDDTGSIIIDTKYEQIKAINDEYENGYIVKNKEGKQGLIKYNKEMVLEVKYDQIDSVCGNGLYVVTENGTKQVVKAKGEKVFDVTADAITGLNENGIIIRKGEKYGLLDHTGAEKIACQYQDLRYAFSEYYIAKKNGKEGIVKGTGEEVLPFDYEKILYRKDENFFVGSIPDTQESKLIDTNFQEKVTGILSEVNREAGYMKVRQGEDYHYYNFKFEEKKVQDIFKTNEIYVSKQDGKYGYVNKDGVVIVNYIYDDAKELNSFGYAAVKKDGLWGCIDHQGKVVVEPSYHLDQHSVIDFIGKWHYGEDINANFYTDEK